MLSVLVSVSWCGASIVCVFVHDSVCVFVHNSAQARSGWCREVTAAGELVVEVWDLGGTRGAKQLKRLADNPSEVIRNSRFLGRAEIPLVDTLTNIQRGQYTCLLCVSAWSQALAKTNVCNSEVQVQSARL